jgi:hypothetical protein
MALKIGKCFASAMVKGGHQAHTLALLTRFTMPLPGRNQIIPEGRFFLSAFIVLAETA